MRVGVSLAVWDSLCCFDSCFCLLISSDRVELFLQFYDFSGFAGSLFFVFRFLCICLNSLNVAWVLMICLDSLNLLLEPSWVFDFVVFLFSYGAI